MAPHTIHFASLSISTLFPDVLKRLTPFFLLPFTLQRSYLTSYISQLLSFYFPLYLNVLPWPSKSPHTFFFCFSWHVNVLPCPSVLPHTFPLCFPSHLSVSVTSHTFLIILYRSLPVFTRTTSHLHYCLPSRVSYGLAKSHVLVITLRSMFTYTTWEGKGGGSRRGREREKKKTSSAVWVLQMSPVISLILVLETLGVFLSSLPQLHEFTDKGSERGFNATKRISYSASILPTFPDRLRHLWNS